jgi:hypothetical protein
MQYIMRARGYSLSEKHKRAGRPNPDTLPVNHFVGVLSDERRCRNGNDCDFGTPSTSSQSQTEIVFFLEYAFVQAEIRQGCLDQSSI